MSQSQKQAPLLKIESVSKKFGDFYALKEVNLECYAGEIHALMGENGAGKSTLMKILAGVYTASAGQISIAGQICPLNSPKAAIDAGISLIYQEIHLSPNLTVAENIFLGREIKSLFSIKHKQMLQETQQVLTRLGAQFSPTQKVSSLSIAEQQQVEIARALHRKSRILIMDEPTAALSSRETEQLFEVIKKLRQEGLAIIYISHRMAEIYELANRVSVLRDGSYIGSLTKEEINPQTLVQMMVGRTLDDLFQKEQVSVGAEVLRVEQLGDGEKVKEISLVVRAGEIVGLSGLVGAGRSEFAHLLFGIRQPKYGAIYLNGQKFNPSSPRHAIAQNIALLPENRKEEGLFLELNIAKNAAMATLERDATLGVIQPKQIQKQAEQAISKLNIRVPNAFVNLSGLSGGNQQKVLLSRWMAIHPKLFILDEPTRGVDVGAKSEIYKIITQMAKQGVAILMISSELPEIIGMSDRVYVMQEGTIAGELTQQQMNQENIMALACGAMV